MVVVDDDFLRNRLLAVGDILARFPFLNNYRSKLQEIDKRCTTCAGGAAAKTERLDLLNGLRQILTTLSADEWAELKQKLSLQQGDAVLISYRVKINGISRIESKTV